MNSVHPRAVPYAFDVQTFSSDISSVILKDLVPPFSCSVVSLIEARSAVRLDQVARWRAIVDAPPPPNCT